MFNSSTTAAYQRGIHSVGEALKFRTKAFLGVRKKDTPNIQLCVWTNRQYLMRWFFCFSLDIICRERLYMCSLHRDKLFIGSGGEYLTYNELLKSVLQVLETLSQKILRSYNVKGIIRVLHGFIFPCLLKDVEINSYFCSALLVESFVTHEQKCHHGFGGIFLIHDKHRKGMCKRFFKTPERKW